MAYHGYGSNDGASGYYTNEGYDSLNGKNLDKRHTPQQIQELEGFYKECPHPDKNQRCLLGLELGLEPKQIEYWFQNKRTQMRIQNMRSNYDSLHSENCRIRSENNALQEALKNMVCRSCKGIPFGEEENKLSIQNLQHENTKLKNEFGRAFNFLAKCVHADDRATSHESGLEVDSSIEKVNADNLYSIFKLNEHPELEKLVWADRAASAMNAMMAILKTDQPFGLKESKDIQYDLNSYMYDTKIPGSKKQRYIKSKTEFSKYSAIVTMRSTLLVDMLLDPGKSYILFPTIFSKARTVRVLETGLSESRSGVLQLINEKTHMLSPYIQPREFRLLQHCKEIKKGVWVIVEVSCNGLGGCSNDYSTPCWKHPSGWMIEAMPNGNSKVTCIEHVEVNDDFQIHPIYKDIVKNTLGFGAKRWILTLLKTRERQSYLLKAVQSSDQLAEGRKNMIKFAFGIINNYNSIFNSFVTSNYHQLSDTESSTIKVSARRNTAAGDLHGIIISAACSFSVPASPFKVFDYLSNNMTRNQWDFLCNNNPAYELLNVPAGSHSTDGLSVIRPSKPHPCESNMLIFQESMMGPYESLMIYAPVEANNMLNLIDGMSHLTIPVLASGFVVTTDETSAPSSSTTSPNAGGSLITVAFQNLVRLSLNEEEVRDKKSKLAKIVNRAIRAIEGALGISS